MSNDDELLKESIDHWRAMAAVQRDRQKRAHEKGEINPAAGHRAETYERTAQALEKELATGVSHCVDHLLPRDSSGRCTIDRDRKG